MKDTYVLLMTFYGPKGEFNRWKRFNKLEEAKEYLACLERTTEEYKKIPMIVAPILSESLIMKCQIVE